MDCFGMRNRTHTGMMTLKELSHFIFKQSKDILFPLFCVGCEKEGEVLCEECVLHIKSKKISCCPVCAKETGGGVPCSSCHSFSFLDSELSVLEYKDHEPVARLIHELKYNSLEDVKFAIQKILFNFFSSNSFFETSFDSVIAIPLHKKRFAERGFNQSDCIAEAVSQHLHIPVDSSLHRVRFTRPQVGLSGEQRQKNIQGAFQGGESLRGKKVLIVDDVFTTGSTLQECAKALKASGVAEVHGFTLARALSQK